LEKYKRIDENKIKELNLQIERYTVNIGVIRILFQDGSL